jgi:hypothetical protein
VRICGLHLAGVGQGPLAGFCEQFDEASYVEMLIRQHYEILFFSKIHLHAYSSINLVWYTELVECVTLSAFIFFLQ